MKDIVKTALVLAVTVVGAFSLAACGGGGGSAPAAMSEAMPSQQQPSQPEAMPETETMPEQAQPSPTQEPSLTQEQQERLESDRIKASFDALSDNANVIVGSDGIRTVPTGMASRDPASRIPEENFLYKSGIEIGNRREYSLYGISLAHGWKRIELTSDGWRTIEFTSGDAPEDVEQRRQSSIYAGLMKYGLFYLYVTRTTFYDLPPRPSRWEHLGYQGFLLADTSPESYDNGLPVGTWRGAMLGVKTPDYASGICNSRFLFLCTPAEASSGNLLTGEAIITITDGRSIDIRIENIKDTITDANHDSLSWNDITIGNDGSFSYVDSSSGTNHRISGTFTGPKAEEVSGIFFRSLIYGGFGAKRQ